MLPVIILSGGLATRMHPITETMPKGLICVAGKPFIEHQLEYLRNQKVKNVVLCLGHLGEMIEEVVGDGSEFNLNISYSYDGPSLLGTGGAIKKALPLIDGNFFVLYGDSFLPIDFGLINEKYKNSEKEGLMTVMKNQGRWDKSNVLFQNGTIIEYNKKSTSSEMEHIDYGLSILSSETIAERFKNTAAFDLAFLFQELARQGMLEGFEVTRRFYEIGSKQGLEETEEYFRGLKKL